MMGGRATAEKLILGNVDSGADDDIRQATRSRGRWWRAGAMTDEVGPVDLRQSEEEHPFLGRKMAQPRMFSQETAHEVEAGRAPAAYSKQSRRRRDHRRSPAADRATRSRSGAARDARPRADRCLPRATPETSGIRPESKDSGRLSRRPAPEGAPGLVASGGPRVRCMRALGDRPAVAAGTLVACGCSWPVQ